MPSELMSPVVTAAAIAALTGVAAALLADLVQRAKDRLVPVPVRVPNDRRPGAR